MQTSQVRDHYPKEFAWPPVAYIKPNSVREFNAYAAAYGKKDENGKIPAVAMITEGFMNGLIKGDASILAAIMGHELAHLLNKHQGNYQKDDLKFRANSRDQEIEADLEGVKIAVAANYPYNSGVRAFYRAWLQMGSYSHFEGLTATHPSFIERLEILDKNKAHIWKSMAAFQNGYFFLNCEQYKTAESMR
jgi:Zn-dependent protease with chaperone function